MLNWASGVSLTPPRLGRLGGLQRVDAHQLGTMKRALITGITGQDGLYLSELLLGKGYRVYGLIRGQNNPKADLVRAVVPDVTLLTGDLTDLSSLVTALSTSRPDEVYNLGAISFVAYSWEHAHLTSEVTGKGVLNMLRRFAWSR